MAFTVQAIRQGTTYNLYGRDPYGFIGVTGLGSPPILNVTRVAPQQHGASFLTYRGQPRYIFLELMLLGDTDSDIDDARDELLTIFHPADSTQLKITLDDASTRYLNVRLRDDFMDYPVGPDDRHAAAQLRVVVPLVAYNPIMDDDTWTVASFNSQGGDASNGYYAYPDDDVLEYESNPSVGDTWSGSDIGAKKPWTIAFTLNAGFSNGEIVWRSSASVNDIYCIISGGNILLNIPPLGELTTGVTATAGNSYIFACDGERIRTYKSGTLSSTVLPWHSDLPVSTGVWRDAFAGYGTDLGATLSDAQVINKALNSTQVALLNDALLAAGNYPVTGRITYAGTWYDYPILLLKAGASDLVSPVIYHPNSGRKLDFTGATVSANTVRVIDTRPYIKTLTDGNGTNKIGDLVDGSDMDDFPLAPTSIVTDGENGYAVAYSSGATPTLKVFYKTKYWSI